MNLHHLPESIIDRLADHRPEGMQVSTSHEPELLGTAGALKKMEKSLQNGPFWVLNADSLPEVESAEMARMHRDSGARVTLALRPWSRDGGYSPVEIAPDGRIIRIAGVPREGESGTPYTFIGAQMAEPDLLDAIPPGRPCETTGEVYTDLIRQGVRLQGFVTGGAWVEIGRPAAYLRANLDLLGTAAGLDPAHLRNLLKIMEISALSGSGPGSEPVLCGDGAGVGNGVVLEEGVVLGPGVTIGAESVLRRTVVWDGSRVGTACQLVDCLIAGAEVPPGSRWSRKIALPDGSGGVIVSEIDP